MCPSQSAKWWVTHAEISVPTKNAQPFTYSSPPRTHTRASSAGCASSLPPPMYNLWLNKNPIFLPLSPFVSSTSPQPPTIRRRADPALARPLPPPVPAHPCPNDVGRRALHRASLFGQLHTRQRTGRLFANGR